MTSPQLPPRLAYTTAKGRAFQGDSRLVLASQVMRPGFVDLISTL